MRKCIKKSANYEKVQENDLRRKKTSFFHMWCAEAFRKYTNIDPLHLEGQSLLGQHFISQSALILGRNSRSYNLAHTHSCPNS